MASSRQMVHSPMRKAQQVVQVLKFPVQWGVDSRYLGKHLLAVLYICAPAPAAEEAGLMGLDEYFAWKGQPIEGLKSKGSFHG